MKHTYQNQIVKELKNYKPEKIIIFGSASKRGMKKDSDIDILVIKNTSKKHYKRIPEVRKFLYGIDRAIDILVLTPKEVEKRINLGDFFIEEIINNGKILYERFFNI